MLYARVLRSPHPHARVVSIDASEAVGAARRADRHFHENANVVWGAGSVSGGRQYNEAVKARTIHRRYIFNNPVRFVGDPVAAVAATDRHLAEHALTLIKVEYELLPFVLEPEAALADEAPRIWPEGNLCPDIDNQFEPVVTDLGDVEAGFAAADQVFEQRYDSGFNHNAQLEHPLFALAHWQDGTFSPCIRLLRALRTVATTWPEIWGSEEDQVRVVCSYMGGGFGNKNQNQDADLIAATLARHAECAGHVRVHASR